MTKRFAIGWLAALLAFALTGHGSAHAFAKVPVWRVSLTHAPTVVQRVAEIGSIKVPSISDKCRDATSWNDLIANKCIEDRKQVLFFQGREGKDAGQVQVRIDESAGKTVRATASSGVLSSLPALIATPEEDEALGKARAIRQLENQERLDVERDLRDFLDAR